MANYVCMYACMYVCMRETKKNTMFTIHFIFLINLEQFLLNLQEIVILSIISSRKQTAEIEIYYLRNAERGILPENLAKINRNVLCMFYGWNFLMELVITQPKDESN